MDDDTKIIIRHIPRQEEEIKMVHVAPASRWKFYLILVPAFIIMAVLGIFFFAVFFALFVIAAAGFGFRLWWLRRELRKTMAAEEGEYRVIEDAEIIETETDKTESK